MTLSTRGTDQIFLFLSGIVGWFVDFIRSVLFGSTTLRSVQVEPATNPFSLGSRAFVPFAQYLSWSLLVPADQPLESGLFGVPDRTLLDVC
jgi:hypothetical protein